MERSQLGAARARSSELTSDTRELCEVVDDRITRMDMIVDEGDARLGTLASQNRHTSKSHAARANDLLGAIRMELGLLLQIQEW